MGELIAETKFKQMFEDKRAAVLEKLRELELLVIRYGTLPNMTRIDEAIKAVERINFEEI